MIANTAVIVPLLPLMMVMYQPSAEAKPIIHQLLIIGCLSTIALYCDELLLSTCLSAAGDATFTTATSLSVMWVCSVGLGYFLTVICKFGIYGAWIPNIVCYTCNTIIYSRRLKGEKWKKM